MAPTKADAEALVPQFKLERLLNQDQAGRRSILYGHIHDQPGILILERAPFSSAPAYLSTVAAQLQHLTNLGANDVYFWYLANSGAAAELPATAALDDLHADLKINLIWPCTAQHVAKYSRQGMRVVTETPDLYARRVRPYMAQKRAQGRLNWVYNIIEGRTEVEDVIYRTELGRAGDEGFLLLPDLNWDRKTLAALHLLGLVERRDIWSLRDLKKKHLPWLRHMKAKFLDAAVQVYPELELDHLKLYVHYQPTYYHFHIHIVHVALEAGATQAVGKAIGLDSIMAQLETMAGDDEVGMDSLSLTYNVGEASELWTDIYEPLKRTGTASPPQ